MDAHLDNLAVAATQEKDVSDKLVNNDENLSNQHFFRMVHMWIKPINAKTCCATTIAMNLTKIILKSYAGEFILKWVRR